LTSKGPLTFSRPDAEEVFRIQSSRAFLGSVPPLSADLDSIRSAIRTAFASVSVLEFFFIFAVKLFAF
jgi:hypothetical protein